MYLVRYRGRLCVWFDIEVGCVFGRYRGQSCIWFDIEVGCVFGSK